MGLNRWRGLLGMGIGVCLASLASGAWAMDCTSESAMIYIPKGFSIESVSYMQIQDGSVAATLWSNRSGVRTTDNTQKALPPGVWTPVAFQSPAQFRRNPDKSWQIGVDALYQNENGDYSVPFDCVDRQLHADGAEPFGYYVLSYIPKVTDIGKVGFQVKVQLHKGELPKPPQQRSASAARARASH